MRKATVAAVGTLGLLIAIGLSAYAVAAAPTGMTTHAFTGTVLGDVIRSNGTAFENAYKITSSADRTGAGWNEGSNSSTTLPLTGRTTGDNYFADGVNPIRTTYTIGAANANGVAVLTGSGECIAGGTRVFEHQKCKFTETGTYNVNTGIFEVKLAGTYTG